MRSLFLIITIFLLGTLPAVAQGGLARSIRTQPFLTDLAQPVLIRSAKDGSRRLFVVLQRGRIMLVAPGSSTPSLFMDISSKVSQATGYSERGLLGLTFDPQFSTNGYFFVNYTRASDGATIIARYRTTTSANVAGDPSSERVLMTIAQPYANHNGGMVEFGPDGNLYIGMGDGGSANDPLGNAQNINTHLGKMLRITPDVSGVDANPPYTSPASNPYVGVDGLDEIFAIGLRNPWRWSFDRGGTNQLWVADVGQNVIEEVNIVTRAGNYGWRVYEADTCTNLDPTLCVPSNFSAPLFQYTHSNGRCSVTGGYVYRGLRNTIPNGSYVYGDYCTGEIFVWNGTTQIMALDTANRISSFGEDDDGELYVVGVGSATSATGTVEKLVSSYITSDFDGDGKTDYSIFRPSGTAGAEWWYLKSGTPGGYGSFGFGASTDIPTPADFTGDGKTDLAFYRPGNGYWYVLKSEDFTYYAFPFGASTDIPTPGDFDGDGKADAAVYRPSTGAWYIYRSSDGQVAFGSLGNQNDKPAVSDYDGDGKADIGIFRAAGTAGAEWWYLKSGTPGAYGAIGFGISTDKPALADFTGDGKADIAVYRPGNGYWYVLKSEDFTYYAFPFGASTDIPTPGDFDGDGKADAAVYRPSTGTWYVFRSTNSAVDAASIGISTDRPLPGILVR